MTGVLDALVRVVVTNSILPFLASHAGGVVVWHAVATRYSLLLGLVGGAAVATAGIIVFVNALGGNTAIKPAGLAYLIEFIGMVFALAFASELIAIETGDPHLSLRGEG